MKRRNIQQAFVGEPSGSDTSADTLGGMAEGTEAVDIEVRGGKIMLIVPANTPDDQVFEDQSFVGGELDLEDGRVLSFEIQGGAVGAQATVKPGHESDRGVGLSSIPHVPGGV